MTNIEAQLARAKIVKQKYEATLLAKPNVVGIGIGFKQKDGQYTDEVALVLQVRQKIPAAQLTPIALLPLMLDGIPVDVVELGPIKTHTRGSDGAGSG